MAGTLLVVFLWKPLLRDPTTTFSAGSIFPERPLGVFRMEPLAPWPLLFLLVVPPLPMAPPLSQGIPYF